MRKRIVNGLLLLLLVLAAGCGASTARQTEELLARQYPTMNDEELLRYYFQLNDQIARVERPATGTGLGFGIGTGLGSGTGVGVGVSQGVTRSKIADDLRERRNDVRVELSKRGLRP